ncbi:c-type cytochrome [Pendulispora brunnea]|uniref:C-type cytochrome n=1 Tax=Pendulispora brunnea TaxID=2905690 RepID=A0ABZ2K1Y5_9BACT
MRQSMWLLVFAAASVPALLVGACSGDDTSVPGQDAGRDSTTDTSTDSPSTGGDPVRGKYIVDTLASCGDCHTPRKMDGSPDMERYLAGNDCFVGADRGDAGPGAPQDPPGCLAARNLTNHETGLKNRSDQEIRDMFQNGKRPTGDALYPVMPYWVYHNMTDADAKSVVAYLRTVPGIDHRSTSQWPWNSPPPAATPPIDLSKVHTPKQEGNANYESEMRGKYISAVAAACIECHTPEKEGVKPPMADRDKWFAGNRVFRRSDLHLPPNFPETIHSANLTSDPTGLAGRSVEDIVNAIRKGVQPDGGVVCPPMPAGHLAPYSNMTEDDAKDIARYLLSLPPIANARPDCQPTPP